MSGLEIVRELDLNRDGTHFITRTRDTNGTVKYIYVDAVDREVYITNDLREALSYYYNVSPDMIDVKLHRANNKYFLEVCVEGENECDLFESMDYDETIFEPPRQRSSV
jgi:hypothetical protein